MELSVLVLELKEYIVRVCFHKLLEIMLENYVVIVFQMCITVTFPCFE